MRMLFLKTAIAAAAVTIIAGCAVTQGDINTVYDASHQTATDAMNADPRPIPLVEDVDSAFLGDRQVPVAYDASLPAIFRERAVTMPANVGIKQIATLVSNATGYSVHLSPDVFVPRESLVPRESAGDGKTTSFSGGATRNNYEEPVFTQAYTGKVGSYLRDMTDSLGLDWSFDGATINISRFVTRMYQIAAIPGKVSVKSTMSKGMNTSTGNQANGGGSTSSDTGSFSAITSTGRDGAFDQIQSITDELNRLRSPMGRVVVNPQSRLVVVYDTKEAADRMGQLLTRENAISTRQVSIRVRTLQLQLNNGSQAGVNADVVFNAIQGGLAKYAVSFTSPTSLSSGGGTVGLSVLKPNTPFSGTNAVINALNLYGKTITDTTQTKLTLNGLPVSVASFQSDDYLRSTTPSVGSISGTSGGVPGLTPGTVTTGDFVNILPSVNDHNQIVLAYWADSSKLNGPFTSATVGSGQTLQQIQLAHTIGSKNDQTIALSDGQTIVLYGTVTDQSDSTTNGGIAGITGTWNKSQMFQVIMLTASVVPSM
ncbi:type II secretory pathway protein [Paraburkholderia rhizosphaerae]|uniref:Type IVB pilus formation R64 PilN family outer membrane protein n=1 Tax=Paraburkholderia rhizosphaerae TaxID=480658 RepID=A0A4R8LPM0_9BURK|nr:type II secretory pathway protein [Paraburkholderia rhizosphaerae]TDY48267.1 type IVB pilus formation R64 PilN family outer membrane protein [Paraburkholderia rhizosphaerae]